MEFLFNVSFNIMLTATIIDLSTQCKALQYIVICNFMTVSIFFLHHFTILYTSISLKLLQFLDTMILIVCTFSLTVKILKYPKAQYDCQPEQPLSSARSMLLYPCSNVKNQNRRYRCTKLSWRLARLLVLTSTMDWNNLGPHMIIIVLRSSIIEPCKLIKANGKVLVNKEN